MSVSPSVSSVLRHGPISQRVQQIPASGIRRFFDLLATLDDVISLGVGEPDFVTPWHMREAAIYALEKGYTMYTSNYGLLQLRCALADHLARRYGVDYDPNRELLITVGTSEALDLAMRAILDPGDEVIMSDPCYVAYMPCTVLAGGVAVRVPTSVENEFKISAAAIESKITDRTKAILLGYPSNPTGAVLSREELLEIAAVAARHDLLVISDEIYDRLVYEGTHTCFTSLPGTKDRTILIGGFSKDYAMTGWRIGYTAANAEILEAMMKIHQYTVMCAPIISQMAAIEALRCGEDSVQEMVQEYDGRRRLMVKGFNDLGLPCLMPKGAFYAFPSIASTGLTSDEFTERLLMEEHVVVVPGATFGEQGEGHVRCCYANSLKNIEEALHRIDRFVARYRA